MAPTAKSSIGAPGSGNDASGRHSSPGGVRYQALPRSKRYSLGFRSLSFLA
jgi:hypothetical protein